MSADVISDRLGLRPTTKRLSEGEPSFTVWTLDSGLDPSAPLEDHLYFLVERLVDRREELVAMAESANVELWLSFSPGTGAPRSAVFGHELMARIGSLGADLVLDPYPAGRPRREAARAR